MLSRKHYNAVAKILAMRAYATVSPEELEPIMAIAHDMADYFKADNPNFQKDRFFEAVKKMPTLSADESNRFIANTVKSKA